MSFLSSMNIVGSGLTAQQLRLDIVAENITNANNTRTEGGGGAYRRKMVVFESREGRDDFRMAMARAADGLTSKSGFAAVGERTYYRTYPTTPGGLAANHTYTTSAGVRVAEIVEDPTDFKLVYDPTHPDANEEGYVELPNVDMVKEMTDAMAATQAYSAGVTALNTLKAVVAKGLEIGK